MKILTDIIFLDTSIFEKENFLRGHKIKQLGELSRNGEIQVKITDIVYSEILGRIRKNLTRTKTLFKNANKDLTSGGKILKNLEEFKAYYPMPKITIADNYEKLKTKIDSFITDSKIEIISSEEASIKEVFNKYFEREFPFGEGQKKDEFPDAFILSAIEKWCEMKKVKSYVLSTDGDLINYTSSTGLLLPIGNLAEYLDAINRRKAEKEKLEFLDKAIQDNLDNVEDYIKTNYEDELAFMVFEKHSSDAWYEEVEYDPATIDGIHFSNHLITDVEDSRVFVEVDAEINLTMNIRYEDLSNGSYDKEDGIWFNTEYVNEEKTFIANYKFIVEFSYDIFEDEDNYFEFDSIIETKLENYKEDC